MSIPTYTHDQIYRSYKRFRQAPLPFSHDGAISAVADQFQAPIKNVREIVEAAREWDRVRNVLATTAPGDAAEDIVPDTFPAEWAA